MKLIVKNSAGETVSIQIKANETFIDLKERVEEEAGISLDLKDIALKGRKITETQKVMEYFLSYGEPEPDNQVSNVYCAVPGCKNTKQKNPDKTFFEFPTEEIRCHQWVLYCQRLYAGPGKKRLTLTAESTICSDHFRTDQFVKNTDTLLKRTAVPSVEMHRSSEAQQLPELERSDKNDETLSYYDEKNIFPAETQDSTRDEIVRLHLCRLCAYACEEFVLIYGSRGRELKIAEKINLCLPINVQITDPLPKQICYGCLESLEELFNLANGCTLSLEHLVAVKNDNEGYDESSPVDVTGEDPPETFPDLKELVDSGCPLCYDGKLQVSEKHEIMKQSASDFLSQALSDSDLNEESSTKSAILFDAPTSSKKAMPGEASLDVFSKENVLKHDESSKSDNEPISDCYSSLTSPLNLLHSEDSGLKNIREPGLSPIPEEISLEPDFYQFDSESENSSNIINSSHTPAQNSSVPWDCRICSLEFHSCSALFKHALSHSCAGIFQCTLCVSLFNNKEDLESHFESHQEEKSDIICDDCYRPFKTELSLAAHICKNEAFSHKCPLCNTYLKNETKLKYHMQYHDSDDKLMCKVCVKVFPDEIKLQKHNMYIHNNKKNHCCEDCGKVFKSEASLKYHQKIHQNEEGIKPFCCDRCGKTFLRKNMLISHLSQSHKHVTHMSPCFTCKICSEAFPSTASAVSHMDSHHKMECLKETTYSFEMHNVMRLYMCEFCERCFAEGNILNTHRDQQHPTDTPFECKYCDAHFALVEDAIDHRSEHLNDDIPNEYVTEFTIPKTYLCEYCERCFISYTKYSEHLTVHYGSEPYQCRHCNARFPSVVEAVEHRANHGSGSPHPDEFNYYRPYECHYCSKTFAIEDALVKHIRMHTGEKPFICDQCGKGFSQSSGLYTHQKVHSTDRPYACTMCPRTFKIKGDRDVHVRKHSGDRPYKCEFCGKAFMTQHVYSQHRKIHTGERPYKCDVCGIAFRRSHVLTVHKRIHTGEKPNECDICGKRYRQKGDMLKHRRVQHGIPSQKYPNPKVYSSVSSGQIAQLSTSYATLS